MSRYGKQVNAELIDIDLYVPRRLDGIGMEINASFTSHLTDFSNRLDGAHLIIGMHHRNQNGFVGDSLFDIVRVHQTLLIHLEVGNGSAPLLQELAGLQYSMVFDGAGDNVI